MLLIQYLSVNKLLPDRQSAYRAFRSIATATAGLLSDIFSALDTRDIAALAMLVCFGVLRQIRSIRRSLPRESVLTLISRSKLDYCNVAFAGLPRCELDRLQSVINAAARLTVGAQLHDHITPLLADLHFLRIPQRIQYKLCVLVFNCVHGSAPRGHPSGREHWATTSPALCLLGRLDRAGYNATLGDRAFAVAGPRAWNTLPDAIRPCSSPDNFQRSLKTHLYIQSYF